MADDAPKDPNMDEKEEAAKSTAPSATPAETPEENAEQQAQAEDSNAAPQEATEDTQNDQQQSDNKTENENENTAAQETDEKPAAEVTDEKTAAPETDEKPAAPETDEKPAAPETDEKTAAPETDEKPAAQETDEKPAAPETDEKPPAPETDEKPATTEPVAGDTKEEDSKPSDGTDGTETKPDEVVPSNEQETVAEKPAEGSKPPPADGMDPNTRGDEDEIMSEQRTVADDEEEKIPDDFFYEAEDHVSKAAVSEDSGLPLDLLTIHHSFGYDCQKRANLHMLDKDNVVFCAGNFVQILNLRTLEQRYIRSSSGGGIGAVCVHPSGNYFAVGEKGSAPNINIFEYPSLKLYRILRGGTEKTYAYCDFSPDGKLLASVGGDPDYMLTQWDWKNERIVLRSKAFSQEVFRVTFSTELEGQLTSSGMGHIRFWKMAKTFTGLKLQGQLGKFGKTEISDIEGYVELPDGKVLSGSEWGNLLLWDGGLIKVEICRKGNKPCHQGTVSQIIMDEGELMTVGIDGFIRVWDFETIDNAEVTDESGLFEMEPMNELKVGNNVALKSIVKSPDEEEPTIWFAQDANGGIWRLDLSFSFTSQAPEKIITFHSGTITGCVASPVSHLVATCAVDRTVAMYDYMSKEQLCRTKYNCPASCIEWMPKVVDPKGSTLLTGFDDGVVRVLNFQKKEVVDVHGRKQKDQSELFLKQALKPHNAKVTSIAVDSKGEILATGGDDCTVFFFSMGENYEPIGFIKTPSAVTDLSWSPAKFEKSTLLVCCEGGEAVEIESPETGTFDTSQTYEISGLKIRTHNFKSVKSVLRHEEDLARMAKEEEEKKKKEEEERKLRIERGLETEEDQEEEVLKVIKPVLPAENGVTGENGVTEEKPDPSSEAAGKQEEEEWSPFIPEKPSQILRGFHGSEPGKFWLSMGGFDAGYLYECQFLEEEEKKNKPEDQVYDPSRSIPIHDSRDLPINTIQFSGNGKYLVLGLDDGSVRIQPLLSEDVGLMGPYWSLPVHDSQYGYITHVSLSHDHSYLFSVGADGNFFTFRFMDQDKVQASVEAAASRAKIPSAKKELEGLTIPDIDDPKAYSIEDAKQKSEHDKKMRLAEEKKASVRRTIDELRNKFKDLLQSNLELPEHLRLDRKEFEMDPEIKVELAKHTEAKIEVVKKEMAWEEEKHKIALEKIKSRFIDVMECDRIVVKCFYSVHEVSSFRSAKLSEDFYKTKAEVENKKTSYLGVGSMSRTQTKEQSQGEIGGGEEENVEGGESKDAVQTTTLKGSMGERINKALAKVEEKKRKRAARRAQWEELFGSRPSEDWEDPEDVAAIQQAHNNMGDYKLKSADDYVVPDHLRMNADKAKFRLLVIKDLIHKHKYDFNQHLLKLRSKKVAVIEEIKELVTTLKKVHDKLPEDERKPVPPVPVMDTDELPEKKYEYTRETLLEFKEKMRVREEMMAKGIDPDNQGGQFGSAAGFDNKKASKVHTSVTDHSDKKSQNQNKDRAVSDLLLTPLEMQMQMAEQIRLQYQRDRLLQRISELITNFDAELRLLRHDKFKLDIDLKNADLRHVTLFEELLLLKDFEKQENVLAEKVETKNTEKLDMQAKVVDVQAKIEAKKKDIEKLQEKEKALLATFTASLGDNNKFGEYLTKVFKKKIKRSKKKVTEGAGSDDESDEESEEDSDWSDEEDESDSEGGGGFDLDVCPMGCDQNLYDNTCALREKRLDIEEGLADEKKNKEALNKELEAFNKKVKIIISGLKQAENELEAFQLEKQRKINELDVVVTLKLNQIQYVVNNELPNDLSQCLVFESGGVVRLTHRIKELEHEKYMQKKQMREAKKKHVQLIKDRRVFESRISQMEETCNAMMVAKFGRTVDLEKVETVTVNRQQEELKEKLRQHEIICSNELAKWDEAIQDAKNGITREIREHTSKLDQLNMLLTEKNGYEKDLDSRQRNLGDEYGGARFAEVQERQRLIQLVHLQAQEVEALKEEITLLSRKGGHILPPAQPPMPPSAHNRQPQPPPQPQD